MQETSVKTIEVVCGALVKDGRVLIARRVSDVADGWYEFPGGKIEPGETAQEALIREWQEEMRIRIRDIQYLASGQDQQGEDMIRLTCFTCTSDQTPVMHVHDDLVWTEPDKIYNWKFFESDRHLVKALENRMTSQYKPAADQKE